MELVGEMIEIKTLKHQNAFVGHSLAHRAQVLQNCPVFPKQGINFQDRLFSLVSFPLLVMLHGPALVETKSFIAPTYQEFAAKKIESRFISHQIHNRIFKRINPDRHGFIRFIKACRSKGCVSSDNIINHMDQQNASILYLNLFDHEGKVYIKIWYQPNQAIGQQIKLPPGLNTIKPISAL